MKQIIIGILILALAITLAGCGSAPAVLGEEEEEPVGEQEEEEEEEEESTPPAAKGLAEILALDASDIGPGWERIRIDVKAKGNWIDQTFHCRSIEDKLELTEQVIEIIRVYPDIESALLDSELGEVRYRVSLWEEQLEELTEAESYSREFLEAQIEQAKPDLPFWDEAYRHNDIILRKGNIIVSFKVFRGIRRYDPLSECFTPVQSFLLTTEQEQWLDEENYVNELLFDLAEKAEGKITEKPNPD